jgi:phosphopentomutase
MTERKSGMIFCNLVDFDMLYGHRKDVEGFAKSLEEFDRLLTNFLPRLSLTDMLMITADHGCDPDPRWPTTDHSREYVPIVAYSPASGAGVNLRVRDTLADMGQTVAENFGATISHGKSFLAEIRQQRSSEAAR